MTINGKDLNIYGALVMGDYNVGTASVQSNFNMGGNSTTPISYSQSIDERPIPIPLAFKANTTALAIQNKSRLLADICTLTNFQIYDDENDIYYTAVFSGVESETILMPGVYTLTLQCTGVMHGALISFTQTDSFTPQGYTENGEDCRLIVTVATLESDGTYKIGDITFKNGAVTVGTEITIDGFDKIVYVNGAPGAGMCDIISFPKLYPGKLTHIECKDPVTIEYYPVYK